MDMMDRIPGTEPGILVGEGEDCWSAIVAGHANSTGSGGLLPFLAIQLSHSAPPRLRVK